MADTPQVILLLPNGPELIRAVNRNLLSNAKRKQPPSITLLPLRDLAKIVVNESAIIPLLEVLGG